MDWILCNSCGSKPNQSKLFLTACGHILCQNCTEKAKDNQCGLCKKPLKIDEINKAMRSDLLELFKDPCQVAADLINEIKQTVRFQTEQREIFAKLKNAQMKREADKFNEVRAKQVELTQQIESRKKVFVENNDRLKSAREEKKELMKRVNLLRQEVANTRPRKGLHVRSRPSGTRTEPPSSKYSLLKPPVVIRAESGEFSLPDQSTTKIVTSTPIANIDACRRDYRNRMFFDGMLNPSPIN